MLALAVLPSLVLFYIVWKFDRYEKEPPKLLWALFGLGAATTVSAAIIELLFGDVILAGMDHQGMLYILIENSLIVAVCEEAGKYIVLKKVTWKHPAFNYTFDAVVYAVTVSLGFATLENILYLVENGIGVALIRAVFSVPGHVIDAIFMGYYYGTAKYADAYNDTKMRDKNLKMAFLVPVLIHGFYDFCLSTEHWAFILIFFVFEIAITVVTARKFIKLSKVEAVIPEQPKV